MAELRAQAAIVRAGRLARAWRRVLARCAGGLQGLVVGLICGLAAATAWSQPAVGTGVQETAPPGARGSPHAGQAIVAPGGTGPGGASAPAGRMPLPINVPRIGGRLTAQDLGLVINTADPYSVAVGEHYIRRRGLRPEQVLRVQVPVVPTLTTEQFDALRKSIDARFGRNIQALALAWVAPYAVQCSSISGALALGLDPGLCERSCTPTKPSRYFNAPTVRPQADLGLRLSMLLAAPSVEQAIAMIDRGVASDFTLARRGRPPVTALLMQTADPARNVRLPLYPQPGPVALPLPQAAGVMVRVESMPRMHVGQRVFALLTGAATLDLSQAIDWVPGALADHLTSYGGDLLGGTGQSNAMEWIASGATASHGTVTEPCNHPQKFPHPQVLLLHYLQGATAVEAYWRSVAWPQQALFIGEPLAAPFSPPLGGALLQPAAPPPAPTVSPALPPPPSAPSPVLSAP